ncbi:MAG: hypothetical protein ACREU9_13300 [Gammaproteobacteria bacterium]
MTLGHDARIMDCRFVAPYRRCAFRKGYSDADIAALVYYVTGRFGARAATVTPDQVAGRREKE